MLPTVTEPLNKLNMFTTFMFRSFNLSIAIIKSSPKWPRYFLFCKSEIQTCNICQNKHPSSHSLIFYRRQIMGLKNQIVCPNFLSGANSRLWNTILCLFTCCIVLKWSGQVTTEACDWVIGTYVPDSRDRAALSHMNFLYFLHEMLLLMATYISCSSES